MTDFPLLQVAPAKGGGAAPAADRPQGARTTDNAFGKLVDEPTRRPPERDRGDLRGAPSDDPVDDSDPVEGGSVAEEGAADDGPKSDFALVEADARPRQPVTQTPAHWPVAGEAAGSTRDAAVDAEIDPRFSPTMKETAREGAPSQGAGKSSGQGTVPPILPAAAKAASDGPATPQGRPFVEQIAADDAVPEGRQQASGALDARSTAEAAPGRAVPMPLGATMAGGSDAPRRAAPPAEAARPQAQGNAAATGTPATETLAATAAQADAAAGPRDEARLFDRRRDLPDRIGGADTASARSAAGQSAAAQVTAAAGTGGTAMGAGGQTGGGQQSASELSAEATVGPDLDGEGLGTGGLTSAGSGHATAAQVAAGSPQMAQHAARQLALSVVPLPDGPVEIRLSPEELGRVRLTVSVHDGVVSVAVQADRPETADLLRRNIDALAREFRALGYEQSSFSFDQRGEGRDAPPSPQGRPGGGEQGTPIAASTEPGPAPAPAGAGTSGLDLRL